ncbi:MAG: hypothetical protein ABI119_15195, partial [Gemmatimonadaceae bacterium]
MNAVTIVHDLPASFVTPSAKPCVMDRWFDAEQHHRRSIRLNGYDYAQPGAYFIPICTHDRSWLFGEIIDQNMRLNVAGLAAETAWAAIPTHFPRVRLDAFVVMPNHVHGIIVITPTIEITPGGLSAYDHPLRSPDPIRSVRATHASPQPRRPTGPPRSSLGAILGSYKSAAARQINRLHGT